MKIPSHFRAAQVCVAATLLAFPPLDLVAQTVVVWNGGTGDWTTPANWTPAADPNGNFEAQLASGTITLTPNRSVVNWVHTGGTLAGPGNLTVTGAATLDGGVMSGTGTTILQGASTIGSSGLSLDAGRILRNQGTVASAGNLNLNYDDNTGSGRIDNATGALWRAQGSNSIFAVGHADVDALPGFPAFNNAGTFRKETAATTSTVDVAFNNTGTVDVQAGTLSLTGAITQHVGTTLTGGTWIVRDGATLDIATPGAQNIATNQGDVTLRGPGSTFARIDSLVDNQGAFRLLDNRGFTAAGAFTNSGTLQLGGGTFTAPALTNTATGDIHGHGSVAVRPTNSGLIRAAGGTLSFGNGIADGAAAGSRVQIDAGATLNVSAGAAGSRADFLAVNGALNVGANTFTVDRDYSNASFGAGNSFNARAAVTGAGAINASGDTAQAITGAQVANGTAPAATLALGNVRTGSSVTRNFEVANTGATGPDLRGALQTTVNGGNLNDARLSGSGVTAGNFGPLAPGGSQSYQVTLTGSSAGPLTGQQVRVANNFDNVADQTLALSGAVYQPAQASALPTPINLGTMRTGTVVNTALPVTNTAPATGGYTETLGASFGAASPGLAGLGSVTGLGAGVSSNALSVSYTAGAAGAYAGGIGVNFVSQEINGSGLGLLGLGSQGVNFTANVNALAVLGLNNLSGFSFTTTGPNSALLDFGSFGAISSFSAPFQLFNAAVGPSDSLLGGFDFSGLLGTPFGLTGAAPFDLGAGASLPFAINFAPGATGLFSATFAISSASHNAFQTDLGLGDYFVTLRGEIRGGNNPVPDSPVGLVGALALLATLLLGHRHQHRVALARR